ncbi:MAG: polyprenyl diphosphate synthase [Candidatus Nealsonbacteria bacterium]
MNQIIPKHLGIIMDGNRRWARKKGLFDIQGHVAGLETFKKIVRHCREKGVKILTVFAFSTENWQRSDKEVDFLMALCQKAIDDDFKDLAGEGIRIKIIGQREMLSFKLIDSLAEIEELTKNNKDMTLNIALSYGGRAEIVSAVKAIIEKKIPAKEITEMVIAENLQATDLDLLIRTGEEQRISNFLIWQAAYAELYFSEKYWPDFSEEDLSKAFEEFALRNRRHGK